MPRIARTVVIGLAHHVIQRGNRRQDVFFSPDDFRMYLTLLREVSKAGDFTVHAYCLMQNHVHLIVVPHTPIGLRRIGEVNRRYARYINKKNDWRGYLWQGRFASYPMDERYSYEAVRYVEMNPVRAGICQHPTAYRWSSARQRVGRENEQDYKVMPLSCLAVEDWESYWQESMQKHDITMEFAENESQSKPLGSFGTQ